MTIKEYKHALKALKDKRKEFENKIKFIDDEINIINKDYINRNAKFKIDDEVGFRYRMYKIDSISVTHSNLFTYNITSLNGIIKTLYSIYESNLKLIERAENND